MASTLLRMAIVALWVLTWSACASSTPPSTPEAPAKVVVLPSFGAASVDPPAVETPPPSTAEVREPAAVACRLSAEEWDFHLLRLREGGEPFASVTHAPATVVFGQGQAPRSSVAVLDDGRVLLRLIVLAEEVPLFTRAPTMLAGILVPEAQMSLDWLGGAPGTLRVGEDPTRSCGFAPATCVRVAVGG